MFSLSDGEERLTTHVQRGLSRVSTRGNIGVLQSKKEYALFQVKDVSFLTGLIIKTTMSMARGTLASAAPTVRF